MTLAILLLPLYIAYQGYKSFLIVKNDGDDAEKSQNINKNATNPFLGIFLLIAAYGVGYLIYPFYYAEFLEWKNK